MNIKPKASPIYQTSVFSFEDLNDLENYFEQPTQSYMYSRYANPNSDELAQEINELEGGAGAVVTSSGMSAILTAILTYCQAGDHLLCAEDIYGGSATLLSQELSRLGIQVTYVPSSDLYQLSKYIQPNTKAMLAETMSNPLLKVLNIRQLATECHRFSVSLIIDNTFATPVITRPFELGADLIIHSVTKYLSGHSDVTAGVVVCLESQLPRAKQIVMNYGLNLSPFESWLASRGVKTLRLRVKEHSHNALHIARFLAQQPKVKKVYYPGLESHPDHVLAREQGSDLFGGMVSFQLDDDLETVNKFMRALQKITFSPSLAGVKTSISHPLKTSHRSLQVEQQHKLGITMGLIRLSVGIEEVQVIEEELKDALAKI